MTSFSLSITLSSNYLCRSPTMTAVLSSNMALSDRWSLNNSDMAPLTRVRMNDFSCNIGDLGCVRQLRGLFVNPEIFYQIEKGLPAEWNRLSIHLDSLGRVPIFCSQFCTCQIVVLQCHMIPLGQQRHPTKWLSLLSEFDAFGLTTFWKSRNHFISTHVTWVLNWK